jgi:GNAT superfamily N-acetyltransferase
MPGLTFHPLSLSDQAALSRLLDEEERAWQAELNWDFSPIRNILSGFLSRRLLPGFAAFDGKTAVAYSYFLAHHHKGIIGTIYVSRMPGSADVAFELLERTVESLRQSVKLTRIEAQIMPFNGLSLTAGFTRLGFESFSRYFLELDMSTFAGGRGMPPSERVLAWDNVMLPAAAEVVSVSYRGECDARICEDYRTLPGCTGYLRSMIENPGCGVFLPTASFVSVDHRGLPCGLVLSSRISTYAGMIPQIAVLPEHQAAGFGRELIGHALLNMRSMGFRSVGLTVTKKNRRAFEWYQRLGFRIRKEFCAYVWDSAPGPGEPARPSDPHCSAEGGGI